MNIKKTIFVSVITLIISLSSFSKENVQINLNNRLQKFEGWGVSLSWWAHQVGKKFSD